MSDAVALDAGRGCPSGLEPASNADLVDPAPFVKRLEDGGRRLELSVYGAKCAGCIAKIEGGLKTLPGLETARLNLSTGKLAVEWRGDALEPLDVARKISDLGYRARPFDPEAQAAETDAEGRFLLRCMAVAGFAAANIMLLSVSVWAGHDGEMGEGTRTLMHWVSALIALPAAAFAGRPFFRSAFGALKAGRANMDVPISLAVILALGLSVYEAITHGEHAYFDAAVMLLFFLLIGRYLDHRLRAKARAAAQNLLALQATTANRINADGVQELVAARKIAPGDRLVVWPGDRAPVNGEIIEGSSMVDCALVTGESAPVKMGPGDTVYAGVVNQSERLVMRAGATVDDSLVADLARLIEAGEQSKSRYVRLADRAASLYVPLVHSLALATFVGWFFLAGGGAHTAIMNAIAVLIITCPCALGLAAPAVQVVATGTLFKAGVLVKSGDALERLAEVDTVVFDKTGTLTYGRFQLANAEALGADAIGLAARLARISRHPLARAVVEAAGPGVAAAGAREIPGEGVEAEIGGWTVRFGRAAFAGAEAGGDENTEVWLSDGARAPVRFAFRDAPREDAAETVAALQARGLRVEMVSGDREGPAAQIAGAIGFDAWAAECDPAGKIARLEALAAAGRKVAMVGDGLNDAPSLAAAHASLSPGGAADASQAAADFVYQGSGLAPVLAAYDVSKRARRRMLENFAFAAGYNAIAIPLAVFGFVTPLIAALAMSGSSVIVTLNALRLKAGSRRAGGA